MLGGADSKASAKGSSDSKASEAADSKVKPPGKRKQEELPEKNPEVSDSFSSAEDTDTTTHLMVNPVAMLRGSVFQRAQPRKQAMLQKQSRREKEVSSKSSLSLTSDRGRTIPSGTFNP